MKAMGYLIMRQIELLSSYNNIHESVVEGIEKDRWGYFAQALRACAR